MDNRHHELVPRIALGRAVQCWTGIYLVVVSYVRTLAFDMGPIVLKKDKIPW